MAVQVLYTAHARAAGGRDGHAETDDGLIRVDLSTPKEMGGRGLPGTTTPEHLFAAGYAACFGSSCEYWARQMRLRLTHIEVRSAVGIGPAGDAFGLAVQLDVRTKGLTQDEAERIVAAGHAGCPYSRAIHGNVDVQIQVTAE